MTVSTEAEVLIASHKELGTSGTQTIQNHMLLFWMSEGLAEGVLQAHAVSW